ncbi:hypothetical protein AC249_AIPGENE12396 [Exaiptasia diaphana]|nr:hypothetical protein AC249_AIPGENE12396 [Exaiptasia diaphana]
MTVAKQSSFRFVFTQIKHESGDLLAIALLILIGTISGFAATNVSETYDAKVFAVATLLSSYLIYNSVKIIDQADIDYLELLSRRTQAREEDLTDEYKQERDALVNKVHKGLKPKGKNGFPITGPEFASLLEILVEAANEGSLAQMSASQPDEMEDDLF